MASELTKEQRADYLDFKESSMQIVQREEDPDNVGVSELHDSILPVIAQVRIVAKRCGYAIGWHGSLARDVDLIAVPWETSAFPAEELVERIVKSVRGWIKPSDKCPSHRPHGRKAWSIHLLGTGTYIDLSVMPLVVDAAVEVPGEG